jgi:2-methylisocitrate lyase-like PEP mutase family enzyme
MSKVDPHVQTFRQLHESGTFIIPNPWDVGSARLLEQLGFKALATTSAGFAWSLGRSDNGVTIDELLDHLHAVTAAVTIPVSADFERGFATDPEEVAANVTRAVETGIAGLSIEDTAHLTTEPLFEFELAVDRIRAARRAIDESGTGIVLTARTEGFLVGRPDIGETIRRLTAFAEAGADCLFAPGLRGVTDIEAVVRAVAPKPVNVLMPCGAATFSELVELRVRRISVGSGLARTAWSAFLDSAREIANNGSFDSLARAKPFGEMNASFADPVR